MSIKSQKAVLEESRVIAASAKETDSTSELSLRPKSLDEYIGQTAMKKHIKVSIESARIRKEPIDHVLLYGPPGL